MYHPPRVLDSPPASIYNPSDGRCRLEAAANACPWSGEQQAAAASTVAFVVVRGPATQPILEISKLTRARVGASRGRVACACEVKRRRQLIATNAGACVSQVNRGVIAVSLSEVRDESGMSHEIGRASRVLLFFRRRRGDRGGGRQREGMKVARLTSRQAARRGGEVERAGGLFCDRRLCCHWWGHAARHSASQRSAAQGRSGRRPFHPIFFSCCVTRRLASSWELNPTPRLAAQVPGTFQVP